MTYKSLLAFGIALLLSFVAACSPVSPGIDVPAPLDSNADITNFASSTDGPEITTTALETVKPHEPLFDIYTAELIMPALAAILESCMLNYGGSSTFPQDEPTDLEVSSYLYAYAQANTYVEGTGATLSAFELQNLIDFAYGERYTYEQFVQASNAGALSATLQEPDVWSFGEGESYPPEMSYLANADLPLDETTPYRYSYIDSFDDAMGGQINVYLSPSSTNEFGVTVERIEIVEP